MATETRTITLRIGPYSKFDPEKFLPGEIGVVTSGDPYTKDGRAIYACFVSNIVKRFATYEDMLEYIQGATQDIQDQFTQELEDTISSAKKVLSSMEKATEEAGAATQLANTSAENAKKAAEEARKYVLGDISSKTATFSQSAKRENIKTGEDINTLFGKIQKYFSDIKNIAFSGKYSDLSGIPTEVSYSEKDYGDLEIGGNGEITIPETTSFTNPQVIKDLFGEIIARLNLQVKINEVLKNRVLNTDGIKIKTGTMAKNIGTNVTSYRIFTLDEIQSFMGVTDRDTRKFFVFVMNGDGSAKDTHIDGCTWSGTNLFAVFDKQSTGNMRINFAVIYTPVFYER